MSDKTELWNVYQKLQSALASGNSANLQATARHLVDQLGAKFQTRDDTSGKTGKTSAG